MSMAATTRFKNSFCLAFILLLLGDSKLPCRPHLLLHLLSLVVLMNDDVCVLLGGCGGGGGGGVSGCCGVRGGGGSVGGWWWWWWWWLVVGGGATGGRKERGGGCTGGRGLLALAATGPNDHEIFLSARFGQHQSNQRVQISRYRHLSGGVPSVLIDFPKYFHGFFSSYLLQDAQKIWWSWVIKELDGWIEYALGENNSTVESNCFVFFEQPLYYKADYALVSTWYA